MRAPSICAQPGCPNHVTKRGKCDEHQPPAWQGSTRRARLPGNWAAIRARVMRRDRGLCQIHGPRCTLIATEVDHIQRGDNHALTNLQAVCATCHRAKTQAEATEARTR